MDNYRTYLTPPSAPEPTLMAFPDLRGEWRVAREGLRIPLSSPQLLRKPRGRGEPVLLLPGFKAPEYSMRPLQRLLKLKGYAAKTWGLGTNQGDVQGYVDSLIPQIEATAEHRQSAVALVGWSLGGVVAREIARERPDLISTIVTYGSPVIGGPAFTVGASNYSAADRQRIRQLIEERNSSRPITTSLAIVFTRRDTIVSWPACIDRFSPNAIHYEVDGTHFSMGVDPTVWGIVLERLSDAHKSEI